MDENPNTESISPKIKINPELDKLKELNLFQDKLDEANEFLRKHGTAKFSGDK